MHFRPLSSHITVCALSRSGHATGHGGAHSTAPRPRQGGGAGDAIVVSCDAIVASADTIALSGDKIVASADKIVVSWDAIVASRHATIAQGIIRTPFHTRDQRAIGLC